jgi:hypothetical protein
VSPEVNQEGRPVAGEPVPFEIGQCEREAVVDADEGVMSRSSSSRSHSASPRLVQYLLGLGGG